MIANFLELPVNFFAQEVEQNRFDFLNLAFGFNFPQFSHLANSTGPPRIFIILSFFFGKGTSKRNYKAI